MNGIDIETQLRHQHKLSKDISIEDLNKERNRILNKNISNAHGTKFVKVENTVFNHEKEYTPIVDENILKETNFKIKEPVLIMNKSNEIAIK